jgi:hypothetical protein
LAKQHKISCRCFVMAADFDQVCCIWMLDIQEIYIINLTFAYFTSPH